MLAKSKIWENHRDETSNEVLEKRKVNPVEIHDDKFLQLIDHNSELVNLWKGCEWAEGPVYFPEGNLVIWSDIPNNRMLRYEIDKQQTFIHREPSNNSNGNYRNIDGNLVSCEHRTNRITLTDSENQIIEITSKYNGKRLNSPNDLVIKNDKTIWFTDPPYGIISEREGNQRKSEIGGNYTYIYEPNSNKTSIVDKTCDRPNGLAFSDDETKLYIADSGEPGTISLFDVNDNKLSNKRLFATVRPGIPDGFRVDINDNIWTSAKDGVHCYDYSGKLLGKILVPEQATANLVFGDKDGKTLYICGDTSLYKIRTKVQGSHLFWIK